MSKINPFNGGLFQYFPEYNLPGLCFKMFVVMSFYNCVACSIFHTAALELFTKYPHPYECQSKFVTKKQNTNHRTKEKVKLET